MRNMMLVALAALMLVPAVSAAHSVTISNGGEATAGSYTMQVDVEKFRLTGQFAEEGTKGEGHIHYLVNGKDACSAGKADCSAPTDYATASTSFTFTNLVEGDVLTAELVLANHQPSGTDSGGNLNGDRVTDEVTVKAADNSMPGFEIVAGLAVLGAVAAVMRRK